MPLVSNLLTDVMHPLICEDREKVKGKGVKGLLIYFYGEVRREASPLGYPLE